MSANEQEVIRRPAQTNNETDRQTDAQLTDIFTGAEGGIVLGASADRSLDKDGGNHMKLKDGTLHTIHVYGALDSDKFVGVYIPARFNVLTFEKTANNAAVVAEDPRTGEALRVSHVQVASSREVRRNARQTNGRGSIFIGKIGAFPTPIMRPTEPARRPPWASIGVKA